MISVMLLSRFLSVAEYGTYSQLLLVVNITLAILMFGLPNSINYFLAHADSQEEKQNFINTFFTATAILSFLTGLALVAISSMIIDYFDNPMIKSFLYFLAVYPWTKIVTSGIDNILIVAGKVKFLVIFRCINSGMILILIACVFMLGFGFSTFIFLYLVLEAGFTIASYLITGNLFNGLRFCINRELTLRILKFSIPIGAASVLGVVSVELDKIIIGGLLGTEKLAIYANAGRELPFTIIATSITAVLLPKLVKLLAKGKQSDAVGLWGEATILSYVFICFFSTALVVFAPQVMTILYSEQYISGVDVFRVYSIILILRVTYFGIILNSIGKTKFILVSSLLSLILNLALSLALYYLLGFIGPAVATFFSILTVNLVQLRFSSKLIGVRFGDILPWRTLGRITWINGLLGGITYIILQLLNLQLTTTHILYAVLIGIVYLMIYTFLMIKKIKLYWNRLNSWEIS